LQVFWLSRARLTQVERASTPGARHWYRGPHRASLRGALRGVAAALRDGLPTPVDPRDAVASLEIIEALRETAGSSRRGSRRE
jgi:predicted dehydrogenase